MAMIGTPHTTTDDATPRFQTGLEIDGIYNSKPAVFKYVKVLDIDTVAGYVMTPASATDEGTVTADRSGGSAVSITRAVGVAVGVISAGNYGWILKSGLHNSVLTDGSVTAGQELIPHATTDGGSDSLSTDLGEQVFASALAADVSTAVVANVYCR